jgi:signal transduction histidine kinase/CheY-like chemotaxis protein
MRTAPSSISFDSKVLIGLLSGAVLLGVVLFLAYRSVERVHVTSAQAHHTQNVRLKLEGIAETVLNMETGQRGFLLTSQDEYIEPYESGRKKLAEQLPSLQQLIEHTPAQQGNFNTLRRLLDTRQAQMAHALQLHADGGFNEALSFVVTNQGHDTMEAIRNLLNEMSAEEVRVLEIQTANERDSLGRNFFFSVTLSVVTVGLLFLIYLLIRREIDMRTRTARLLDETNASLEARVKESTRELSTSNAALMEEVAQRRIAEAELQRSHELLEVRVRERTAELVEANSSKSRFLSAASHDLRQPLHSLVLLNATLRGQALSNPVREVVELQRQSLDSMSSLVHSLLNISMLESGVVQPEIGDFRLGDVISLLRTEFAPLADAKGLCLRMDEAADVVRSDQTLLREIVQNLVGNAIRYTERGEVDVRVRRTASVVRIEISDTGPGIPEDKLDLIFEEFHQLRAGGRMREGFGLGLSIVRHLVKLLGIEFHVKSVVGVGTTFTFDLPRGADQGAETGDVEPPPAEEENRGRILLVDDEAPVRSATALFLGLEGHEVVSAASPEEALAALGKMERAPDVIVSDYQLGTPMTGADLIERIRAMVGCTIPAIVLSGDTLRATRRCSSVEDCRVFHKPVDAEELALHIRRTLESRASEAPATAMS